MRRRDLSIIIIVLAFTACILFYEKGIIVMKELFGGKHDNITVVIDAGHGGFDPGKVGVNKALEKIINLSVAYKLKNLLEQNEIQVIMTRTDNGGLYTDADIDKKRADLKRRVSIINSSNALIAVSIHQNSFTQEKYWGAQVFYYEKSEEGKILAEIIQASMKDTFQDGNHRLARSNNNYYMLLHSNCPLVIVEGGFLSNRKEAELLCDENYQEKLAWGIHLGILEYIHLYGPESD
jgi:N-acetylmuramoyl-L-alanine amidase